MPMPILTTKLFVPPRPPQLVPRPSLLLRLNEGPRRGHRLSLISAAAGFGKTMLLAEWAAECGRLVAWLSLDEGDSDPARFLTYLVAALRTVAPVIGDEVSTALESSQTLPIEAVLTALINTITTIPHDFALVLDDYHLVDAGQVDTAITFLLEHLPPNMQLVIATREDPRLPLARLRSRGQLTELRSADLRFTNSEAATLLNRIMGLSLSAADIDTLETRTEGWAAGLHLAAISMQGYQDAPGFIRAFAGDHRYIMDYLIEEVLQRQPEPVRRFLLHTAILDRLSGALCDAVTGQEEGNARLESLARANSFVVPLDDKRQWYRYHHLFADVLCAHLMAQRPEVVPALHRRASDWFERHGWPDDAINHALAAGDFERAATLIEQAAPPMRQARREVTLLGWLQALPEALFHARPVLNVHYAGMLLETGHFEAVEARLQQAERLLAGRPESMTVVNEAELPGLPAWIAIYRAARALVHGDITSTTRQARRALTVAPEDDHVARGGAVGFLGLAAWTSGDLETAQQCYTECTARMQKAGHLSDALGSAMTLADIRIAQGQLREAMSVYERGLQIMSEPGGTLLRSSGDIHVGISELLVEQNDLDGAMRHLLRSKDLGEHLGLRQNRHRWGAAMARIRAAEGDLDGALELLQGAERAYVGDYFPNVRPIASLQARVWVRQGRLRRALNWARAADLTAHGDISYLHEFEHITLARVLLAHCESKRGDAFFLQAMKLLELLLRAAEDGGRGGSVIEVLVLQALAQRLKGDASAALPLLERALLLAEPEGYVRVFVDEGQPVAELLRRVAKNAAAFAYARELLVVFGPAEDTPPMPQALIEPLSARELEVLRLLETDLGGPEMARALMVSLNTLRTHTKNIYGKLGVNDRRVAVRRARDLDLL